VADADAGVRDAVLETLDALDGRSQADAMIRLLSDPEWNVRGAAARTLGHLRLKEAIPALRMRLGDDAPFVQIDAAEALCWLGDEAGVGLLLKKAQKRH
jgi:HEAT repeat protein